MTNKEELIKEWKEFLSQQSIDNKICCEPIIDIEELSDWWLSKIEQIRKEDVEMVIEEIKEYEAKVRDGAEDMDIVTSTVLGQVIYNVLEIIKQKYDTHTEINGWIQS